MYKESWTLAKTECADFLLVIALIEVQVGMPTNCNDFNKYENEKNKNKIQSDLGIPKQKLS